MNKFFEIGALSPEEQDRLLVEIEAAIAAKKKDGLITERDIGEIVKMRLKPLPDIQDVQSVYEDLMFRRKQRD